MPRRFDESLLPASIVATPAMPCEPGFVACSIQHIPAPMQQLWQALYQAAFTEALKMAILDCQPTRYQKLLYQFSMN